MVHSIATKSTPSAKIADELTHFLADSYLLYLKTQNFHWNVTGPNFYSLHKLFEEQYQELALAVDEIAERIRALGYFTRASFSDFSALSSLKEEKHETHAQNMIKKLMQDHETLSKHASMLIPKFQKNDDEGTADLLIQRMKSHDKAAWMLKSSL
ncbi:MAG TPA: Dps family protein [Gammaproteobacteria bacterium]|jgi:starvation-inducible DNA-binding protein|nr:Dps family protein [Gammaproteobacteria bacterium]